MSKPSIQPHVVLGLSEARWAELEAIAKSHNCPTVSLMLQAVANGTLVIDWGWKWTHVQPARPTISASSNPPDERVVWA